MTRDETFPKMNDEYVVLTLHIVVYSWFIIG